MRDEWCEVQLGDLITRRSDFTPVVLDEEYVILGVQRSGWGLIQRAPILGSDMKFTKLMKVELDDLVYRTITAFEAPAAVVGAKEVGHFVTPQTFPVFKIDKSILAPAYMSLITTWRTFHEAMASRCTGTVLRRKTLAVQAFASIPIPLPPLERQRRIVDLVGALDDTIAAAKHSRKLADSVLCDLRRIVNRVEVIALGELATLRSGPSWAANAESREPRFGHEPVLGITNTPAGSRLDLSDRKYVRGIPNSAQRLRHESLIMIRTNGNRSRIGNVYRATPAVEGFAVSAFQIAIQPHEPRDSAFLYWFLGSVEVQSSISESASGSTGLGNIAVGWLKQLAVPLLTAEERMDYVEKCQVAANVVHGLDDEVTLLGVLRSDLLTGLLSGAHGIPDSYDELMGA